MGLGGIDYDQQGKGRTEANLFVEVEHGNKNFGRQKLLDHLDSMLRVLGGPGALAAVEQDGNNIARYVQSKLLGEDQFSDMNKTVLKDPNVTGPTAAAKAKLEQAIANLPTATATLLRQVGALRLAACAAHERGSLVGPTGSVMLSYRIDDTALNALLDDDGAARFGEAVTAYLETTEVDRVSKDDLGEQRKGIRSGYSDRVSQLGKTFDNLAQQYQRFTAAANAQIAGIGQVGGQAIEIRFDTDRNGLIKYDTAQARSFAEARMQVTTQLFDQLLSAASGLGPQSEQTVANGLLGAMQAPSLDLKVGVQFKLKPESDGGEGYYVTAGYQNVAAYLKGEKSAPIQGGMFNIDAILKTE